MDTNEAQAPATTQETTRMGPLTQFAIKTAIITIAIVVSATFLMDAVFSNLNTVLRHNIEIIRADVRAITTLKGKLGGKEFWTKIETELEKAASPRHEISPERKQKIMANLRIVADRWRPVLDEVSAIIAGTPYPPPASPAAPAKK